MRPKSACIVCRNRRRKCIRSHLGPTCDFCISRNLECTLSYDEQLQDDGYEAISPSTSQGSAYKSSLLPPSDLCAELIQLYFRYIHFSFHVLFHKPSFLAAFDSGSLSKILLFAVMGISARFSQHPTFANTSPRERGRQFTKEAERLLNLHDASLTTIQACLILGQSAVVEGEAVTESLYFSIACRLVTLLDLPNMPCSTHLQQELQYRVWWSSYETDTWSSVGIRQPKMLQLRNVPLPMEECAFLDLSPEVPPIDRGKVAAEANLGQIVGGPIESLLAKSILVNLIFPKVDDANTRAVNGHLRGYELLHVVEIVMEDLDFWLASLPQNMRNSPGNLRYWASRGLGSLFVHVHFNYHYLNLLLFYQFLHGSTEPNHIPSNGHYAHRCRQSATQLCDLVYLASESTDTEILNSMIAHVLTIASTVQLHILLFSSDDAEVRNAHNLLERNFNFLIQLKTFWSCADISICRFQAFHQACLRSRDDSQFRLDQWMLKFMLEFASPMSDDRVDEDSSQYWETSWSQIRRDV